MQYTTHVPRKRFRTPLQPVCTFNEVCPCPMESTEKMTLREVFKSWWGEMCLRLSFILTVISLSIFFQQTLDIKCGRFTLPRINLPRLIQNCLTTWYLLREMIIWKCVCVCVETLCLPNKKSTIGCVAVRNQLFSFAGKGKKVGFKGAIITWKQSIKEEAGGSLPRTGVAHNLSSIPGQTHRWPETRRKNAMIHLGWKALPQNHANSLQTNRQWHALHPAKTAALLKA